MNTTTATRNHRTTAIAAILLVVALTVTGLAAALHHTSDSVPRGEIKSGQISLTPAEQAEIATPQQRGEIVQKMQTAFAGVAQVGVGDVPAVAQPVKAAPVGAIQLQPVVAYGMSGDHFWVTASYNDMARGAIWGAVQACVHYGVPSWICNAAGNQLTSWSSGWGSSGSHGVWAAIYWAPPHYTGGRW